MGFKDYAHNIEALRKYLASDFVEFVKYHLQVEDGFRIGPPQEQIARFLAEPGREKLIIGFRGLSKTYLVKYYAGWRTVTVPFRLTLGAVGTVGAGWGAAGATPTTRASYRS